jgi:hypothetical protein
MDTNAGSKSRSEALIGTLCSSSCASTWRIALAAELLGSWARAYMAFRRDCSTRSGLTPGWELTLYL